MEAIEEIKAEEREPWSLPMSIFKPRCKEADARDFFDSEESERKMFERDWARACNKDKFAGAGPGAGWGQRVVGGKGSVKGKERARSRRLMQGTSLK